MYKCSTLPFKALRLDIFKNRSLHKIFAEVIGDTLLGKDQFNEFRVSVDDFFQRFELKFKTRRNLEFPQLSVSGEHRQTFLRYFMRVSECEIPNLSTRDGETLEKGLIVQRRYFENDIRQ